MRLRATVVSSAVLSVVLSAEAAQAALGSRARWISSSTLWSGCGGTTAAEGAPRRRQRSCDRPLPDGRGVAADHGGGRQQRDPVDGPLELDSSASSSPGLM
jgi:hypothetical protein